MPYKMIYNLILLNPCVPLLLCLRDSRWSGFVNLAQMLPRILSVIHCLPLSLSLSLSLSLVAFALPVKPARPRPPQQQFKGGAEGRLHLDGAVCLLFFRSVGYCVYKVEQVLLH